MHNQVPNRGLIHGVIPVSRARTVLFLALLLPMACGFGWEVMTAFRDAHGVTPMTVAEIENASLRSGNVAIRGIDPARTASNPHRSVIGRDAQSWKYVYVPLSGVTSERANKGNRKTKNVLLAKLWEPNCPAEIQAALSEETFHGTVRPPISHSIFAANEPEIIRELVRDTELDNVWVVYPNDPPAKAKNPWWIFLRSLFIVGGVASLLILMPMKDHFFVGRQQQICSIIAGLLISAAASYVLIVDPRGPAIWIAYASLVSMYALALGAGMIAVAIANCLSDFSKAKQEQSIAMQNEFCPSHQVHRFGAFQFEFKEIDDKIGAAASFIGLAVYTVAIWNVPISSIVKLFWSRAGDVARVGRLLLGSSRKIDTSILRKRYRSRVENVRRTLCRIRECASK